MRQSIPSRQMEAGAIQTGMVVRAKPPAFRKVWRVVTHITIPPNGKIKLELNPTGKKKEEVIYDTYGSYDLVTYQVDQDGNPIKVGVEPRVKKS